jgi:hypothetical protein
MKFRKKPVVIDAVQWTGNNEAELAEFCSTIDIRFKYPEMGIIIPTLEGDHTAIVGDYIIRGIKGEFYPCKQDIFHRTYDPVL